MALSLAISGIDASYGAVKALRGVSMHVDASETVALLFLCLKENFRSAPKLIDAMAPSFFKSFSASLCQAMPSLPL